MHAPDPWFGALLFPGLGVHAGQIKQTIEIASFYLWTFSFR